MSKGGEKMTDYSQNFDEKLNREDSILNSMVDGGVALDRFLSGIGADSLSSGVFGGIDKTTGVEFKVDRVSGLSAIQSRNFVTGSAGWRIDSSGNIEANTGTFRGTLTGNSIAIGTNAWHVDSSGNMWWGSSSTYAGATIKISSAGAVNFTTGTFSGTVSGATITGGTIRTASSGQRIELKASNNALEVFDSSGSVGTISGVSSAIQVNAFTFQLKSGSTTWLSQTEDLLSMRGDISPVTSNTYDLGLSAIRWRDLYLSQSIFFSAQTGSPSVEGELLYFDSGGVQNLRTQVGSFVGSVDLTAV